MDLLVLIALLIVAAFFYLLIATPANSGKIRDLKQKIADLEKRLQQIEQSKNEKIVQQAIKETPPVKETPTITEELVKEESVLPSFIKEEIEEFINQEPVVQVEPLMVTPPIIENKPPVVENIHFSYSKTMNAGPLPVTKKRSQFWAKTEKQFIENWTGILGAIIMVAGVVFFGIYTALKVTAFYRFLLITGFSMMLAAGFIYLKRHDKWLKMALWLRSSAGAVFLFGCLGSGGIPGLQWIYNPLYGLIMLDTGIVINLLLGYAGSNQVYSSLHVLLSLVALSIIPSNATALVTAALVSMFGIALTYREKWNYHLLLTISSFFAFHLYWFNQQPVITISYKILGIITVVAVSIMVALVHYRNVYKTAKFDAIPFIVHLINWFYFGIGLFLYSQGMRITTFFISIGAIAAFFLARRARKLEIRWLYHTDTLVALATAVIALISLRNWDTGLQFILAAIFAEVLLFLLIMLVEKDDFLYKAGMLALNAAGLALLIIVGINLPGYIHSNQYYEQAAELLFCFFAATIFIIFTASKNNSLKGIYVLTGIALAIIFAAGNADFFLSGTKLSPGLIFSGAIITFFLSRKIRAKQIKWLYYVNTLLAEAAFILAIVSLTNWQFDITFIIASVFAEVVVFNVIAIREKEKILYTTGCAMLYVISAGLIVTSILQLTYNDHIILYRHTGEIAGCFVAALLFVFYGYPKEKEFLKLFKLSGFIIGAFFALIYIHLYYILWIEYGAGTIALALIFLKEKTKRTELALASIILILSIAGILGYYLADTYLSMNGMNIFLHGLPLLIFSAFIINWSGYSGKYHPWIGIYLFAIAATAFGYMIFNYISPFIPGVIWLALSPIALELSRFASKKLKDAPGYKNYTDRFLMHVGFALIAAFLARHILVHLQSEQYLGSFVKIRLIIEIFAFAIFIYWALARKPEGTKSISWNVLHPLFLELIILFFILSVSVEATVYWYPVIWISAAFIMAFSGNRKSKDGTPSVFTSRLTFYSIVMYWVTASQVAFVTSNYVTPSNYWYDQGSLSGIVSIILQFLFLIYYYRKCSLKDIYFPSGVKFLGSIARGVERNRNSWIFYPLILCTALFLFYSFDKSILTLLWVIECFMVFVLSIMLKEKYFRYVALVALALCIIRLIFFDLAQTSTLTRALVFIGVGIIMLIMNSIYNKYKERFANE